MEKTKQKTRVLAYTLAKEIDLGYLESVAGGQAVNAAGHMTQHISNESLSSIDYSFDY